MSQYDSNSTFWVRCVGYKQDHERFFTVGQEYEVCGGVIANDRGFAYLRDHTMKIDSSPNSWYLSRWYEFEIVEEQFEVDAFEISIDDILGISTVNENR